MTRHLIKKIRELLRLREPVPTDDVADLCDECEAALDVLDRIAKRDAQAAYERANKNRDLGVMNYTAEQRAIIARMGAITQRMERELERSAQAQLDAAGEIMTSLRDAMLSLREITTLGREHGDAFREYLDTLKD